MKRILYLVLAIALPFSAKAEEFQLGTAEFAIMSPSWPCELVRKKEKELSVLRKAVLWNTFGTEVECLKKDLEDPRLKLLELHLINEPCARNKQCGKYEFLYGLAPDEYDKKLKARDPALIEKLEVYLKEPAKLLSDGLKEGTSCYVSIGLESNISTDAALVMKEVLSRHFPRCGIVWNPVNGSKWAMPIEGTHFELHGAEIPLPSPCIANLDGEDISFPDRPSTMTPNIKSSDLGSYYEKRAQCSATFLWVAEFNGRGGSGSFVDPRERKNFVTESLLDDIIKELKSHG